jgi:transcriptional regulator with XRE-family HTH domain
MQKKNFEYDSSVISPSEKLRRARVLIGASQYDCDDLAGVKLGRTFSYERGKAQPSREFIEPLARAWSIDVDWFFDGVDNLPSVRSAASSTVNQFAALPVVGQIPCVNCKSPQTASRTCRASFVIAPGSHYRLIADSHLEPVLQRGDIVLVSPVDMVRDDTMMLIQSPDRCDVAHVRRQRGEMVATVADGVSTDLISSWTPEGLIVEVIRNQNGVSIAFECELGLSPAMMILK